MSKIYYQKNVVNPNFGFNKLSVGNPFNFYGYENSKNSFRKPNYGTLTHKVPRVKMYNDTILEENKIGLKTNPKQPPMTNTYNLNTVTVRTEQKYNPYFAANNYPQWMDKVKDLMNYTYNEEKAPIYYAANTIGDENYGIYGQNNLINGIKKADNITYAPLSSRVPKIDNNIYSSLTNKMYNNTEKNQSNIIENNNYYNNANFINGVNYIDNQTIINDKGNSSNNIKYLQNGNNIQTIQNNGLKYDNEYNLENLNYPYQTTSIREQNNNYQNNQVLTSNEIISDNNSKEYYKESKGGLVKSYAYFEDANLEHREYMEDQGIAIENFNNDPNKILFGLFDGHGGDQVSKYLQKYLPIYMKQYLPFTNYFQGFSNLFKVLDEKVRDLNCPDVGSTATLVYIERQNNKKYLYCINIGDTRCIIINKNGIMRLSKDDRIDDPSEKERITKEGGVIYNGRIYGILMLSRCFGDWGIKNYGVSCEPHISKIEINDDDLFLVMASDGVWDFMGDEEFKVLMEGDHNSLDVCKDVIIESMRKGSSDNISCFVIKF